LYFQGALNTWNDPALFERFQLTEAVAEFPGHIAESNWPSLGCWLMKKILTVIAIW
jgi:hypothetical protein